MMFIKWAFSAVMRSRRWGTAVSRRGFRNMTLIRLIVALLIGTMTVIQVAAAGRTGARNAVSLDAVNAAAFGKAGEAALIIKAEVLLDRSGFSPGVIDGRDGDNFRNALAAFQQSRQLPDTGRLDAETWAALEQTSSDPALTRYEIAPSDVAGPFARTIPRDFAAMAKLPGLSYTSAREELAEKFHLSEALLQSLNPGVAFDRAGETVAVANLRPMPVQSRGGTTGAASQGGSAERDARADMLEVDKGRRVLRAYDKEGRLLAFYPASIGSAEKPAPSGTFKVTRVARNPDYHYDPKFGFKGVKTDRELTIRPGPNNPVGLVWIDLSAPSYGIHGTPDPDKVGKIASHGCIRLTNWDALALAALVHRGTAVKFLD